jgi:DNA-binding XRE family transcriptional regulator
VTAPWVEDDPSLSEFFQCFPRASVNSVQDGGTDSPLIAAAIEMSGVTDCVTWPGMSDGGRLRQVVRVLHRQRGQRLREYREAAGMTRDLLGRLVGTSSCTVYAWEAGKQTPSDDNKLLLAVALNVDVDVLFALGGF